MAGLSLSPTLSLSGGAGASAPAWAPADLGASLLAFWDAERADLLTLATAAVTTWTDATANGYAITQSTTSAKPTYSATSFNSRPGVTFDKANSQRLVRTGIGSLPVNADPCEIWLVMDQTALVADTALMSLFEYGNSTNAFRRAERLVSGGVNYAQGRVGTGAGASAFSNANIPFSGKHVVRYAIGATSSQVHMDGNAGLSQNIVPATSSGNMSMGMTNSGSFPMTGIINACLVTAALDADQAAALLAWGKARAGIA